MKKISLPVIVLNTLLTMAAIVLVTFTYLQYRNLHTVPFGMDNKTTIFSISEDTDASKLLPFDNARIKKIVGEIQDVTNQTKITIINSNSNNMGLGVFDSRRKYMNPAGSKQLSDTLKNNNIILRKGSYYDGRKSIQTLSGKKMSVAYVYDENYVLFDKDHEYIYNFFSDLSLGGTFYIESEDKTSVQKIINILEENNFNISYENSFGLGFLKTIKALFSNALYSVTVLGFVFIIFNLFLFYFTYFNNFKKRMRLHIIYGARYRDLILSYTCGFILNDILAAFLGTVFYVLIFKNTEFILPVPYLLAAAAGIMVFNALLFLLCIFFKSSLRPKNLLLSKM